MPARCKWALFGSAGDRSDAEIAAIAAGVCAIEPDRVVITELESYLRGRGPGEVSAILRRACLEQGMADNQIHIADSPLVGVRYALQHMEAEDLGLHRVRRRRIEAGVYFSRNLGFRLHLLSSLVLLPHLGHRISPHSALIVIFSNPPCFSQIN